MSNEDTLIRSLSELRRSGRYADPTLLNLVGLLQSKLELRARLPVLAHEADTEGHEGSARLFRSISVIEDQHITDLLETLRDHVDRYSGGAALKET
jgi:hypothetical protein